MICIEREIEIESTDEAIHRFVEAAKEKAAGLSERLEDFASSAAGDDDIKQTTGESEEKEKTA